MQDFCTQTPHKMRTFNTIVENHAADVKEKEDFSTETGSCDSIV